MINASHVTKVVGGRTILQDVTLEVARREALRIVGTRGSGRTTLLRILATLVPPTSGTVSIDGIDAARQSFQARRKVAFVSPDVVVGTSLTVGEYLWIVARSRGISPEPRVNELMTRAGLCRHAAIHRLTAGERAALALTAALMVRPDVILLDGALCGVAESVRMRLAESIQEVREGGAAVVVVSDDDQDELVALCGRVVSLQAGRLYSGLPKLAPTEPMQWAL